MPYLKQILCHLAKFVPNLAKIDFSHLDQCFITLGINNPYVVRKNKSNVFLLFYDPKT